MIDKKTEDHLRKWREAAKILSVNPNAKVICPECGIGHLNVIDEVVEEANKLDRYMKCDKCGRWNVLTMEIPKDYPR